MGNEKEGKFAKILGAVGDSIEALVGSMPKEKQDEYKLKYYKEEIEEFIEHADKEELEQMKEQIEEQESLTNEEKVSLIRILLNSSSKENREKAGVMNHDDYVEYKKAKEESNTKSK